MAIFGLVLILFLIASVVVIVIWKSTDDKGNFSGGA